MSKTFRELKEEILRQFDPDDIVDILGLTAEEILDAFEQTVVQYQHKFDLDDDQPDEEDY